MNPSQKTLRPKPPDKGSFPLDHEGKTCVQSISRTRARFIKFNYDCLYYVGECKQFMVKYMECLTRSSNDNSLCRQESKDYLQCRMDKWENPQHFIPHKTLCFGTVYTYNVMHFTNTCRQLMAKEDFKRLGYKDNNAVENNNIIIESTVSGSSRETTNDGSKT